GLLRSGHVLFFPPGKLREVAHADPPTRLEADDVERFRILLARFGISPEVVVRNSDGTAPADIAIHSFRNGEVTLIALQRDLPSDSGGRVTLQLTNRAHIYDVRSGSYLGYQRVLALTLDKVVPTILAL